MHRALAASALALAVTLTAPAAFAASGSLTDPDDDTLADILRLSYANNDAKAVMKLKYDGSRPMVENFYVKWGTAGKYYKLQRNLDGTSLWFFNGNEDTGEVERTCDGDRVRHNADTVVSTGTIPRSCMPQAPARVKFQGIATVGLFDNDKTRTSTAVRQG